MEPDDLDYFDGDDANVQGAIDRIRAHDGRQPLCLYLPLESPHPPYGVPEPWFSLTDRAKLPPRIPVPDRAGKPAMLGGIRRGQGLQDWNEERWNELRAAYYGMCARTDRLFGRVVQALRDTGLYGDTAIFVLSDHGDFTGDYGLVEKTQNTFEDCLCRVPFLIKPPGVTPVRARVSDALVELVDFPATVLALAGIEPRHTQFGRSLLPLLAGETDAHRDAVFCEGGRLRDEFHCMEAPSLGDHPETSLYWPRLALQAGAGPEHGKAAMCRTRDWKYVRRLYEADELYDLRRDPTELDNRIADPACAGILAELRERLLAWYQETADVVPWDPDRR